MIYHLNNKVLFLVVHASIKIVNIAEINKLFITFNIHVIRTCITFRVDNGICKNNNF